MFTLTGSERAARHRFRKQPADSLNVLSLQEFTETDNNSTTTHTTKADELQRVVDAWPKLTEADRDAILAIIDAARR